MKYAEVNGSIRSIKLTLLEYYTSKERKGGDRLPKSPNSLNKTKTGDWFTAWDVNGSRWKAIRYDKVMLINGKKVLGVTFNGEII